MFLTLEDKTEIVNAVVRPSLFERQRRVLMTASMMSIHGKIQREGEVVHLVAQRLFDFLADLASWVKGTACFRCLMSAAIKSNTEQGQSRGKTRRRSCPRGTSTYRIFIWTRWG
ncbi:hypothetical protein [Rhizobium leguminosarum]|uniref:hypothetical protein n=1 Tax=Rhizobium leguminosarum TaxID=384 RepID=UPI0021BC0302|nr:hypothetical protein [Rhizobium leguminosarum]